MDLPILLVWIAKKAAASCLVEDSQDEVSAALLEVIMAEMGKTYVCDLCGQEVQVTKSGAGTLVCCDVPMHANSA